MKKIIYLLFYLVCSNLIFGQGVGINTDTPEAALDIVSSNDGLLIPRVSLTATNSATPLITPATGELIYNNATAGSGLTAVIPGFYFWNGTSWIKLKAGNSDVQSLTLTGSNLAISDGNSVDLSSLDTNTDNQTLSVSGTSLTISDGNTVNLSTLDTDNQTLSVSGSNLTISNGNSVDLSSLKDQDWYLENTTDTNPNSIDDNIYTNGSVGIGVLSPAERLSIYTNQDVSAEIGRSHVGFVGHSGYAGFSHINLNSTGSYALLQSSTGETFLNAASNRNIYFRNNNSNLGVFTSTGNFGVGTTSPNSKVEVVGDVRLNGNNAGIIYENKETNKDWRLVYVDNFETDAEGWIANGSLSTGNAGLTRQNANIAGLVGHFIRPSNNNYTVKKYFDLSGMSYSEVKIEFNYLFLDSWDSEIGWLGVKGSEGGNPTQIWLKRHNHDWADLELNGTTYNVSFYGNGSYSDLKYKGEAQFSWSGGGFWIEMGANLDSDTNDETFAIDNVTVYVR